MSVGTLGVMSGRGRERRGQEGNPYSHKSQITIHKSRRPRRPTNRMKFTGHERDPETGLDYMLARYYSSGSGRFLQVDPVNDYDFTNPMSFNKYSYVRCNPIMGTDPTGMTSVKDMLREAERKADERERHRESQVRKARAHYNLASGFTQSAMPNLSGAGLNKQEEKNVQTMANIKSGSTGGNENNGETQSTDYEHGLTVGVGLGGNLGMFGGISGSIILTHDSNGNWDIVLSGGGGVEGGAVANVGIIFQFTNAGSNQDLESFSQYVGGSVNMPVGAGVGAEYCFSPYVPYQGITVSASLGGGTPVEVHTNGEQAIVIPAKDFWDYQAPMSMSTLF